MKPTTSTSCCGNEANDPGAKMVGFKPQQLQARLAVVIYSRFGRTVMFILLFTLTTVVSYLPRSSSINPSSLQHKIIRKEGYLEVLSTRSIVNSSHAPLFYHISPGSTGSRTLYHAACSAGFPSVHHKSFCISSNRGVNGVSPKVVEGARAHFQVLRLYQIAYKCCSYWNKGIILQDNNSGGDGKIVMKGEANEEDKIDLELCTMSLDDWAKEIQTHLSTVLQSSIVGLFDTPYPLLAPQVLELASKLRATPPIVAMTERDKASWASSRTKNHALMFCKKEFSYEGMGASEFDILGCVERASGVLAMDAKEEEGKDRVLHFWDVFEYTPKFGLEEAGSELLNGLEAQMDRHQRVYRPIANYTPNFFGPSLLNESNHPPTDKQVIDDIQRLILHREDNKVPSGSLNSTQTTLLWKKYYKKPLTCRGAVQYNFLNDTITEMYDHPKTCDLNVDTTVEELINLI